MKEEYVSSLSLQLYKAEEAIEEDEDLSSIEELERLRWEDKIAADAEYDVMMESLSW
jgi:hypothetical protein